MVSRIAAITDATAIAVTQSLVEEPFAPNATSTTSTK
jgi:hypothetical protein